MVVPIILDAIKVENVLVAVPVPGTAPLILDTVKLDRVNMLPVMVLPRKVEYNKVEVVIVDRTVMLLPVSVE